MELPKLQKIDPNKPQKKKILLLGDDLDCHLASEQLAKKLF